MDTSLIFFIIAVVASALIAFAATPPTRVLAYKIGAIDIPEDERRMHTKPVPRIGGLAIFVGFAISSLVFCDFSHELLAIWVGGLLLVILGILDDIYRLNAWVKLAVQIVAATIAVTQGVVINYIWLGESVIQFGIFKYPITILWIVGLTNAINIIDGLDGLACGISAICSISICGVALIMGDYQSALITAVLVGACLGFLPYNKNPARIFMGDTGALFLGYSLAVISVQGLFKLHTVLAFIMPISIFALPLFDTLFAIVRRVMKHQSPFSPDRSHLHHKLVDLGFNQKESVRILYATSGIMGLVAITSTDVIFDNSKYLKSIIIIVAALAIFILNFLIMKNPQTRAQSGLLDDEQIAALQKHNEAEAKTAAHEENRQAAAKSDANIKENDENEQKNG